MQVQPYLFFNGRCDEAIGFYRKALGAEVTMLTRFKDNPNPALFSAHARESGHPHRGAILAKLGPAFAGPSGNRFNLIGNCSNRR
jgi:hypothetical protein